MNIVFRADASHQMGTGHVARCLTLAAALKERGAVCRFVCREHPGHLIELIRQRGFETIALPMRPEGVMPNADDEAPLAHASWLGEDWRADAEQTKAAFAGVEIDWLIADHYALDAQWERKLRPFCRKIMAIDDLADRSHDANLLLDQNLVADKEHRYRGKTPAGCGLMLGPSFALLQPEYADLHDRAPLREGPVKRVLVFFGGADTDNLTGKAVAAFQKLERRGIALDVVISPASPHFEAVCRLAEENPSVTVHTDLPSLAPLMAKADLAVGACGTASWERCCLGLPTLAITLADHQKPVAEEMAKNDLIRWLGHSDDVSESLLTQALKEIIETGLEPGWSRRCLDLVDGRGTERVVDNLMTISTKQESAA